MMVDVKGTRLLALGGMNPGRLSLLGWHADISPDGQRVAFVSCEYPPQVPGQEGGVSESAREADEYEIALVRVDGSQKKRLTENRNLDHFPAWSPDGRSIAFLSGDVSGGGMLVALKTIGADGLDAKVVASEIRGRIAAYPPQWSPDGDHLALLVSEGSAHGSALTWSLYVVATDGSRLRRVSASVGGFSWSPDGERLALARLTGDAVVLVTIAADGSDPRNIRQISHRREFEQRGSRGEKRHVPWIDPIAWSPDGTHVLFRCGQRVCVVNINGDVIGQSPGELAESRGRLQATWSPDGTRIALRAPGYLTPEGDVVLATMAPDGSDVEVLVRGGLAMVAEHSGYRDVTAGSGVCSQGFVVPEPTRNRGLVADCETLLGLRDALAGRTLLNWNGGTPIAHWAGVILSGSPLRVTGLELEPRQGIHGEDGIALSGVLPPELGGLVKLQTLVLRLHKLTGNIPPELGALTDLRVIDLSNNRLWGNVPLELGRLAKLRQLYLYGTPLISVGCVPLELMDRLVYSQGAQVCKEASNP